MPGALVDSNVLIAAASAGDQYRERGAAIVERADNDDFPTLQVTNYVLVETLNYIGKRAGQSQAVDFYDRVDESIGFEFGRVTKRDDQIALDLVRKDGGSSFVDATIAAYAAREGLEYCYSFDSDLDRFDSLTRLENVVDPFAP